MKRKHHKTVMGKPEVSVVMPVYNGEKYLEQAVESILNQTFENFEFIIIDDNSSDQTPSILKNYSEMDHRIIIIKNSSSLGITKSLNLGIRAAVGDYIARMDADDISLKKRFFKQVDFLKNKQEIALCGTRVLTVKADYGKKYIWKTPEDIKAALFFMNALIHPSVMIKREVIIKYQYDESYNVAQDYDLWCRISNDFQIANIDEALLEYRWHNSNISLFKKMEVMNNHFRVKLKLLKILLSRELNENEIYIHGMLTGYSTFEPSKFDELQRWCDLLFTINLVQKIYDDTSFKKVMDYRLARIAEKHGINLKL